MRTSATETHRVHLFSSSGEAALFAVRASRYLDHELAPERALLGWLVRIPRAEEVSSVEAELITKTENLTRRRSYRAG
jgi:hypothetical protein